MHIKKWMKKTALPVLAGVMLLAGSVSAAGPESGCYQRYLTLAEEERIEAQEETALYGSAQGKKEEKAKVDPKAWKKINGVCYNGSGKEIPGAITRGIDVSEWQGDINWHKVKNDNVDFAMVRISYGSSYMDKKYDANMKGAEEAGLPVGTYVFSTATTPEMALKEAKVAIEKMKGYKVSYPVVFDLEDSRMGKLSKSQVSKIALAFCNEVRKAGYYPMVYCNTNWYDTEVDWSLLNGIDVWIARYGDKIQAPSKDSYHYTIWQSTDGDGGGLLNSTKGLIDGIPIYNNVDVDFGYVDYTRKIVPRYYPVSKYEPSVKPDLDTDDQIQTGKNGWAEEGGKTYYYENDEKVTGWQKIDGKYYYFNGTKGYLYKDKLLTSRKKNICYVDKDGVRVSKKWVDWKEKRYYMASNGYAIKGFRKLSGKYYYFDPEDAYLYTDQKVIARDGRIHYVNEDGTASCNGFQTIEENGSKNTYFFDKNGCAYKGWHKINGKKYYFYKGTSEKSGRRAESIRLTSSKGVVSVFDKNGVCVKQYHK